MSKELKELKQLRRELRAERKTKVYNTDNGCIKFMLLSDIVAMVVIAIAIALLMC